MGDVNKLAKDLEKSFEGKGADKGAKKMAEAIAGFVETEEPDDQIKQLFASGRESTGASLVIAASGFAQFDIPYGFEFDKIPSVTATLGSDGTGDEAFIMPVIDISNTDKSTTRVKLLNSSTSSRTISNGVINWQAILT